MYYQDLGAWNTKLSEYLKRINDGVTIQGDNSILAFTYLIHRFSDYRRILYLNSAERNTDLWFMFINNTMT